MEQSSEDNVISAGSYVIVQKQNFRKLCKVAEKGTFTLGKEQIEMSELIGKPYWTTFKMIPSLNGKKTVVLKVAEKAETLADVRSGLESGLDNRSIFDDGTSQKLSKEAIEDLRDAGKSSKEIVESLIENSSSFSSKTEYSQEKYIKKKEKKYFRFLTVLQPSIASLQEIYFRLDQMKINSLRMDTLAQMMSYCDVKADGRYLLYDGGTSGLAAAAMLNRVGAQTKGSIFNFHPGNQAVLTLVNAMNFPEEQLQRLHTLNFLTFMRILHQGEEQLLDELVQKHTEHLRRVAEKRKNLYNLENEAKRPRLDEICPKSEEIISEKQDNVVVAVPPSTFKAPRWFEETRSAVNCMKTFKADGLAIFAKEHPLNIVKALLDLLGASRPFVIYHYCREPLQETYMALKQRRDVINLKLFSNFFRGYQILPNRTHPDISMSDIGGYILSGYLAEAS